MPDIAVIGAVNVDICGKPEQKFIPCDSNVGSVTHSIGGVGFNVARNLSLLGANVSFVAALGEDTYTSEIEEEARRFSLDLSLCLRVPGVPNSTYLFVTDENGDMLAAVNDMKINQKLEKSFFAPLLKKLSSFDAVIIDANLENSVIEYLCKNITAPIFADAVSASKVMRLKSSLGYISVFKPNAIEASMLTGVDVKDESSAMLAAKMLVKDFGVGRVYITMGADGVLAYDSKQFVRRRTLCEKIVNTAGAGDSFFACCVMGELLKKPLEECVELALKGAASVCKTKYSVNMHLYKDVFNI